MTTDGPIRILLTGGGTGGHLFPAIAAAEALCARRPQSRVLFIGTKRKMDQTSLAGYGYTVKSISSYGLKGKKMVDLLKALAVLPVSFFQAMRMIISFRPHVVLGVGGYVTGPVVAAARFLGKRTVIHEQNSVPGLANRKLGRFADSICISLPESGRFFPPEKTAFTGNPVRKSILELSRKKRAGGAKVTLTLLVLGGSQGAHRVNELVVEAVTGHRQCFSTAFHVIHQTGATDFEKVKGQYARAGIQARVQPFFKEMAAIYAEADLLVSRAGATTLAEIAVLGIPAILIPYPHAADNHQDKNADHYTAGGGAVKFSEQQLTGRLLAEEIEKLLGNEENRRRMSENMKNLGHPLAAEKIVDVCLQGFRDRKKDAGLKNV